MWGKKRLMSDELIEQSLTEVEIFEVIFVINQINLTLTLKLKH